MNRLGRVRPGRGAQGGFTLMEVVVATAVLSLSALALTGLVSALFPILHQGDIRSRALRLAEAKMEEYRNMPFDELVKVGKTDGHVTGEDGGLQWTVGISPVSLQEGAVSRIPDDPSRVDPVDVQNPQAVVLQVKVERPQGGSGGPAPGELPWVPVLLRSEVVPR